MHKIKALIVISIFTSSLGSLYSNSELIQKRAEIRSIDTEIDGLTKRGSLLKKMDLFEGKLFVNEQFLISFMDDAIQDLNNMRIFETADYSLELVDSSDTTDLYILKIIIDDANNSFFIPYPKIDSNNGFRIGLKTYFYNMYGSLMDFKITTSFNIKKNEAKGYWEVPMWTIAPSLSGIYLLGMEFDVSYKQQFATSKKYDYNGVLQQEYTWHRSELSLNTTLSLPSDFYYSFGPSLSFNYGLKELEEDKDNNVLPLYGDNINKDFSNLTWSHSIGYDNINWIGNFREGLKTEISNNLTVSADFDKTVSFYTSLGSSFIYFWRINKKLNLSGRFNGRWANDEMGFSSYLRGIKNGYINGYLGASINIDLNISIIDWRDILEIQFRPFFDIGIVDKKSEPFYVESDLAYSTGADFILYLDKWKSLQVRGTFGINLSNFEWSDTNKYEFDLSGSLSY